MLAKHVAIETEKNMYNFSRQMANRLKQKNLHIEYIAYATGLSIEEIEKL
jgi:hypothetical protein